MVLDRQWIVDTDDNQSFKVVDDCPPTLAGALFDIAKPFTSYTHDFVAAESVIISLYPSEKASDWNV